MKKLKLFFGAAVMVTGVLLALSTTGTAGTSESAESNKEFLCMKNMYPCPQGANQVVCCTYRTGSSPNYTINYRFSGIDLNNPN